MANETFEKLLEILEGSATNASFRMSDARRAVLIQALHIAIDSGNAVDALRPKRPDSQPFDLNKLTFSQRHKLNQLRTGSMLVYTTDTKPHTVIGKLVEYGLITTTDCTGEDEGMSLLTITNRGLAAK